MRSSSALLAILLLAASCRSSAPATLPAVAASAPVEDGIAATNWHGIPGLFIEMETWRQMLVQIEHDKGALAIKLARSQTAERIAKDETDALRAAQKKTEWAATFGPWLGFAGGMTAAAIIAAILFGALPKLEALKQ